MEQALRSQKFFIILSVLYVVTGIVILIWPGITLDLLGKGVGIGLLVIGLTHIIIYFTKDHMRSILGHDLTMGVIFASLGAFILMHADFVELAIPFAVGILLLIGAMTKIQYSIDMRRLRVKRWFILLILAIALVGVGITLLYNPFRSDVMILVIAVSMIADGILNIFSVLFLSGRLKKIQRGKAPMPAGPGPAGPGTRWPDPPAGNDEKVIDQDAEPGRELTTR